MCSMRHASTAPGCHARCSRSCCRWWRPGLVATIFISIIFAWNEFFLAYNLAPKESTVPMFMVRFVTSEGLFWAKLAASCTMAVFPIVLLGWMAQRQLVRGLSMGAVK